MGKLLVEVSCADAAREAAWKQQVERDLRECRENVTDLARVSWNLNVAVFSFECDIADPGWPFAEQKIKRVKAFAGHAPIDISTKFVGVEYSVH